MESLCKPRWVELDDKDSRQEIRRLLEYLPPWRRLAFLKWCCQQSVIRHGPEPARPYVRRKTLELAELARTDDSADEGLLYDVFFDLIELSNQFSLDLDLALARLVSIVKRQ